MIKLQRKIESDVLGGVDIKKYFQNFLRTPPNKVIKEKSKNILLFNVMPDKDVKEELFIRRYDVWERTVRVVFDRKYTSKMFRSPSHLIFLSSQIHLQKILYVLLCQVFKHEYNPLKRETIKIWPTRVDTRIPKLIRNEKNLFQLVNVHYLERKSSGLYFLKCVSNVNDSMRIYGEAMILNLKEKYNVR